MPRPTARAVPLAPVIQLARSRRTTVEPARARRDADQARAFLARRYGERWTELPDDLGRQALATETAMAESPTRIDAEATTPTAALARAEAVVQATATVAELVAEECDVLAEVLGSDLSDLSLRRLEEVATAVVALGGAPPCDPAWADPSAAEAADVVLRVHGERLLESAELHERVYRWFVEDVWGIPEPWLRRASRRWRLLSRARLRAALDEVSREPGTRFVLGPTTDLLRRAQAARVEVEAAAPLLSSHLGVHDRGPFTDVKAVAAALVAVRDLQDALGSRLDVARLGDLLRADAFRSRDVTAPASTLLAALAAWSADLGQHGVADPGGSTARELAGWADRVAPGLAALREGLHQVRALDVEPATLRDLINDLLARERIEELEAELVAAGAPSDCGAATDANDAAGDGAAAAPRDPAPLAPGDEPETTGPDAAAAGPAIDPATSSGASS